MRRYVTIRDIEVHVGILVVFCTVLLLSSTLAVIYYTKTINHQASIVANGEIQTYSDAGCTVVLDSHDWGSFNTSLGDDVKTLDFYLRNEGNVEVNVTWIASNFTFYNATEVQYEKSSWKLYLVNVDAGGQRLRPENDTAPDRLLLSSGQIVHLRFYLTAIGNSSPEDVTFQTSFNSKDN
jgi:hypothetical protein